MWSAQAYCGVCPCTVTQEPWTGILGMWIVKCGARSQGRSPGAGISVPTVVLCVLDLGSKFGGLRSLCSGKGMVITGFLSRSVARGTRILEREHRSVERHIWPVVYKPRHRKVNREINLCSRSVSRDLEVNR